jgi:hypothetical protein
MKSRLFNRLADYNDPQSFANILRRRRSKVLKALIDRCYQELGHVRIVDLGGRPAYWRVLGLDYLNARSVTVTIVNVPGDAGDMVNDKIFTSVTGDACGLAEYADRSFDLAHSNSVIEHVGTWERMEAFAAETRRLGSHYYVQTPYFWFPIEPHYLTPMFHWWPESWRTKLLMRKRLGHHQRASNLRHAIIDVRSIQLLDLNQMRYLFSDATTIQFEWLGPLPKSIMAIKSP